MLFIIHVLPDHMFIWVFDELVATQLLKIVIQ
jgi:hypothetical protein